MRMALAALAALLTSVLPAAGQYNQPYGGADAAAPRAQAMDEGTRARLREALMFDYARYRHRRNVGIAMGAAGVATYAVGMVFAVLGSAVEDRGPGDGDVISRDGSLALGLGLALAGMTVHTVGVPLAIVNGVRMGRTRARYMSRLNRSIDYDYRRLRYQLTINN